MRIVRTVLAVLGSTAVVAATAVGMPRAVLVEPVHKDVGSIEPGDIQHHTWTLRNAGDTPLSIEALEPTCYCTAAKADAWEIAPGGTTTIRVTIDPSDFTGKVTKGVEIATNDPQNPKQLVDVDLDIRPGIAVVPPELDFGAVPAAGSKPLQVDVKVGRDRPFTVKSASVPVEWLSVKQEPLDSEEKTGVRLWVKVAPSAPPGAFASRVVLETSDAAKPRIEIPVRGMGPGGLVVEPAKLVFEGAAAGAGVGSVMVRGAKGLRVTGVRASTPQLEATLVPAGDAYRIDVKLAAGAKPGRLLAKLLVATADPAQPEITVPVMGVVR